jgi:hypothetical protein
MENINPVKRKREKKIRTQPVEVHWTSFEIKEMPPAKQQEIAQALHDYVRKPNIYTVAGFAPECNVSRSVFQYWCNKYPVIQKAYEHAVEYMGAKRFNAGASRQGVESLMKWAGQYDPSVQSYLALMEQLKAKQEEKPTNIVINMTDFTEEGMPAHMIPQDTDEN